MKRIIWIIITILWMAVIFMFSAADGEASSHTSGRVVKAVQEAAYPEWSELPEEQYESEMVQLTYFVRKMGHFTEYAFLGLCLAMVLSTSAMRWRFRSLICIGIGFLYAVSDELHQSFVAERSAKAFDVFIDTSGVFVGAMIVLGICAMVLESRTRSSFKRK